MKRPKYMNNGDEWMLAENIPDSDLFFFQIPFSCFANDSSYVFLKNYKKVAAEFHRFDMKFYFGRNDSFAVAESILDALRQRPKFGAHVNRSIVVWSDKLIAFARRTAPLPLSAYTNEQLWQLYDQHDRLHTKLYTYGWLPVAVDMFHNNFTDAVKSYLTAVCQNQAEVEQAFVLLTTPTASSIIAKERHEFFTLYRQYQSAKGRLTPRLRQGLKQHQERWGHLGYIYAGNVEPFSTGTYVRQLRDWYKSKVSATAEIKRSAAGMRKVKRQQAAWYRRHKTDPLYRRLFCVAQDFTLTKLYRRHAQLYTLSRLHPTLVSEIAERLHVSRYQAQFMLHGEVRAALLEGIVHRRELSQRLRRCVCYTERGFEQVYGSRQAERLRRKLKTTIAVNQSELKGQPACAGYARGRVKIIIRAKDMVKMRKGDIMVSIATDPDVVPAMKKAAAIVTEQGGITSHAAIVSRELGVPCIIGTKIATQVLKDGDWVEVDATKGVVRKLSR